jgi:hypothetical protein
MADYASAIYREGHEGILVVGYETGMLAPDATALPAAPALDVIGYSGLPEIDIPEAAQLVRGVGSYRALGTVNGRRTPKMSGHVILSGGAGCKKFLQAAFRSTSSAVIADVNRFMCKPVLALGGGAASSCDTGRNMGYMLRYAMLASMKITLTMDDMAALEYEAQALTAATDGTQTARTESQLVAAGGTPFLFQHASLTDQAGVDYADIVEGVTITQTDVLRVRGIRPPQAGGDTNALTRAGRQITVGNETITLELTLNDIMPSNPTSLTLALDNGSETISIAITGLSSPDRTMSSAETDGPMAFTTTILATQVAIT